MVMHLMGPVLVLDLRNGGVSVVALALVPCGWVGGWVGG